MILLHQDYTRLRMNGVQDLTILTPHIIDGFRSILDESVNLCVGNDEMDKYLMTFQNLSHVFQNGVLKLFKKKQLELLKSGCQYLEDLITCVMSFN